MGDTQSANLNQSVSSASSILPPVFSSRSDKWDEFILEYHRQPAFELQPQSFLMYGVSVKLDGPSNAEIKWGGKTYCQSSTRGDVSVVPCRFGIEGAYAEACEFIQVQLQPSVIERATGGDNADRVEIVPCFGVADPLAAQTVISLFEELTDGAGDAFFVDALVNSLAGHLVRYYSATAQNGRSCIDGLPNYLLNSALEYINDCIDRSLSQAEIAKAVGLDSSRFVKAFRASTGKDLHQYVNECRIDRAKLLLSGSELSIEEVGRRVGLNSERRFAEMFQKLTSVSPQTYRQKSLI
jgi:AraC family transcriptional regulator